MFPPRLLSSSLSQISQVVRELKRTAYKPKMAILGARKHYCVHTSISTKPNVDEECKDLLRGKFGCLYAQNLKRNPLSHNKAQVRLLGPCKDWIFLCSKFGCLFAQNLKRNPLAHMKEKS